MLVPILSPLVLTGPVGTLMSWSIDNLFYAMLVISILFWVSTRVLFRQMEREVKTEVWKELKEMILT